MSLSKYKLLCLVRIIETRIFGCSKYSVAITPNILLQCIKADFDNHLILNYYKKLPSIIDEENSIRLALGFNSISLPMDFGKATAP
jgi:hypothetical protein